MYSLGTYKISSTKSVCSPKKALRIMNFAPFNAHTTPLFKNCNILKFADIINVERFILINNCFNKDSQPRTHTILDQLEMVFCLFQVITQSIWENINYSFNHSYMKLTSRQVN